MPVNAASRRRLRSATRERLISSDFSPAMLEAARRRGAELGVAEVEYLVIDAEQIELDDDSVDGVLCRFGYILMADPAAALSEPRRCCGRAVAGVGSGVRPDETPTSARSPSPWFRAVTSSPDPEGPGVRHGEHRG